MSKHLEQLIDLARKYREDNGFTQEERDRQVRSFAFGNTHFQNEEITMGDIDTAMDTLRTEVEHEPTVRT